MEWEEGSIWNKKTPQTSALSEPETKQCPLLTPAIEENSSLCRQIFFFGFSCNWTLQTTGCSSPAETQACAWDYTAKSKGISWPFRLAVTGALGLKTRDNPSPILPLTSKSSTADFHGSRIWYKHLLSTAEYHAHQGQGEMKAFSK